LTIYRGGEERKGAENGRMKTMEEKGRDAPEVEAESNVWGR
jgi:hypothetical protein